MGLKLNSSQKSLESKARPKSSTLRGKARTPISAINSRTHFAWGPHSWIVKTPDSHLSVGLFRGLDPHAEARSHQSYIRPSVKIHLWPWALEKLLWTARMARATSIPWIIWILPYSLYWIQRYTKKNHNLLYSWALPSSEQLCLPNFSWNESHPIDLPDW